MQMPPTSSISKATTVAKIGRLMKKLTMARLAPGVVDHGFGFGPSGVLAPAPPFSAA